LSKHLLISSLRSETSDTSYLQ